MKRITAVLFLLVVCVGVLQAQIRWVNPIEVEPRAVHGLVASQMPRENPYHRLPIAYKTIVRPPVWSLSTNSAGLYLSFYSDSKEIRVRYQLQNSNYGMPHMPSTGVSGVDLYAIDPDGKELWCGANYNFADTVSYRFAPLAYRGGFGYEYRLYLPLYNTVKWLEIGVEQDRQLRLRAATDERKIVLYGTSILQGACASRPGMAWGNILGRRMASGVINLGFSGNGMLEKEMIDVLALEDAKAYVLDCMPNVCRLPREQIRDTLVKAVRRLRKQRPEVPIILTEHSGYPHAETNPKQKTIYQQSNIATQDAYKELLDAGEKQLFLLGYDQIAQPQDGTVEGIHPSDYGMVALADAHEKILREVLKEPIGELATQIPVTQRREPHVYEWRERCEAIRHECRRKQPDVVVMGNSLIHQWGGVDGFRISRAPEAWNCCFDSAKTVNMGCGWDRIENLLWRLYNGALDGVHAKTIVLMIGTNNIGNTPNESIVKGIEQLVAVLRDRQPQARIVCIGILPRRDKMKEVLSVNSLLLRALQEHENVLFADFTTLLTERDGKTILSACFLGDGLHLSAAGYEKLSIALREKMNE